MSPMNGVFSTYLDRFFLVSLDDILAYSRTQEEHEDILRQVLQCLCDNLLYGNLVNYDFLQMKLKHLGHVILGEDIVVDRSKIQVIMDWIVPTNVSEVCSFMGLVGYYQYFVQGFLRIAHPITSLQRKRKNFVWIEQCEASF